MQELHNQSFILFETPQIALHYVTACPVLLKLMATSPPVVSLQADRCSLQITGCVEVFAVLPNSTSQHIFTGNLVSSMNYKITFSAGAEQITQESSNSFENQRSAWNALCSPATNMHTVLLHFTGTKYALHIVEFNMQVQGAIYFFHVGGWVVIQE